MSPEEFLDLPSVLIGSAADIAARLVELRKRTGISYLPVLEPVLEQVAGSQVDVVVVGGGVTGAGVALDAAARGLSVVLLERDDLAAGTSRWSSKLVPMRTARSRALSRARPISPWAR